MGVCSSRFDGMLAGAEVICCAGLDGPKGMKDGNDTRYLAQAVDVTPVDIAKLHHLPYSGST